MIVYLGRRRLEFRILRREEAYSIMNGSFVVPNSLCVCMSDFFLCQRQYGSVWLFLIHSTHHTTHCHNHKIISLPSNNSRRQNAKDKLPYAETKMARPPRCPKYVCWAPFLFYWYLCIAVSSELKTRPPPLCSVPYYKQSSIYITPTVPINRPLTSEKFTRKFMFN